MSVYLVGAGPGDPGLITARGLELLRACAVVIYDRLVSPELIAEAPLDAIRIPRERLRQNEIDELLVSYGSRGLEVVRLKGGDPFVFGRGGEEALALAEAGVPFEVVPGVSALSAVAASAGIPITHRGLSSQVTVVAGHDEKALDFDALACVPGTLVFFMGLASLPALARGLIVRGKDPETPSAVVASGTLQNQVTVVAPLTKLATAAQELTPPALVIVGEVVGLAERLGVRGNGLRVEPSAVR